MTPGRPPSATAVAAGAIVALDAVLLLLPGGGGGGRLAWLLARLPAADEAIHAALFAATAWLLARWLRLRPALRLPVARAVVLAISWGLALEGLQSFVPGRTGTPGDALADAAGALAAGLGVAWIRRPTPRDPGRRPGNAAPRRRVRKPPGPAG